MNTSLVHSPLFNPQHRDTQHRGSHQGNPQHGGFVLLDSLIAILLFSIGILGMVSLLANAVRFSSDAQFRTEAALLSESLMASMWTADTTTLSSLYAGANGAGGSGYLAWNQRVATLPLGKGTVAFPTAQTAVVTITWQGPQDAAPHTYLSSTQIAH